MPENPDRKIGHHLAFTPSLWAAIAAEAARQNRSVQNWLATVAANALEEPSMKRIITGAEHEYGITPTGKRIHWEDCALCAEMRRVALEE